MRSSEFGDLCEIDDLEDFIVVFAGDLPDLFDAISVDACTGSVVHGMETSPLGLMQVLIKQNLDLVILVIHNREIVDVAFLAAQVLLQCFFAAPGQLSRGNLQVLIECLQVDLGVNGCANQPKFILVFSIIEKELLGERGIGVLAVKLHDFDHGLISHRHLMFQRLKRDIILLEKRLG